MFFLKFLSYTPFLFIFVTISFLLIFVKKWNVKTLNIWLILLVYFSCDLGAFAVGYYSEKPNNQWVYNIAIPILYSSVAVFYYKYIDSILVKKIIFIAVPIFTSFHILNIIFVQTFNEFATFITIPWQGFLGILAFLFLRQVVENSTSNPFNLFSFWFSIANMINFIGSIPILATLNWFPYVDSDKANILFNINLVLGYYLYSLLICLGFIWSEIRWTRSSS